MRAKTWLAAVLVAIFGALLLGASAAGAMERLVYTNDSIAAVRASNEPYVIFIHAIWCTTCQAQDRVLEQLADDPRFANLKIVVVDYDNQTHIMRLFAASERTTLIAFRGTSEMGRVVAETNFERLRTFLLSAMQ